jgi:hypothetical protein
VAIAADLDEDLDESEAADLDEEVDEETPEAAAEEE